MSRIFSMLCLAAVFVSPSLGDAPDNALFSAVLAAEVTGGRVDYEGLRGDPRFITYLGQIAATDPELLATAEEQLAFWLNAYNAYTLKLIVDRRPEKSITEIGDGGTAPGALPKTTPWDLRFADIGGKKYTLNEIEHEVIRRRFKDARAHFALNCASVSCPPLRPEAYSATRLDQQLDEQGRQFLRDGDRNRFDLASHTAWLSSIFLWYQKDFGQDERAMLLAAAQYASEGVRRAIESDPAAWTVKYLDYDWSLNAAKR